MAEHNLYVWEGVLVDWTSGLVCVRAPSEKEAWELLYEKDSTAWWSIQGNQDPPEDHPKEYTGNRSLKLKKYLDDVGKAATEDAEKPRKITESEAFVVWGGS